MSSIVSGPGLGSGYTVDLSAQQDSKLSLNTGANAAASVAASASVNTASGAQASASAATPAGASAVVTSTATSAGLVPVDTDRVATIKKAIETGNYPLVPTKISDAMIAAGMLLRIQT